MTTYRGPERRTRVKLEDESSLSVAGTRFWDLVLQKLMRIIVSLKFIFFQQIFFASYVCLKSRLIDGTDFRWIIISGLVTIIISSVYTDTRLVYRSGESK
jgi:hypothetical protein